MHHQHRHVVVADHHLAELDLLQLARQLQMDR